MTCPMNGERCHVMLASLFVYYNLPKIVKKLAKSAALCEKPSSSIILGKGREGGEETV